MSTRKCPFMTGVPSLKWYALVGVTVFKAGVTLSLGDGFHCMVLQLSLLVTGGRFPKMKFYKNNSVVKLLLLTVYVVDFL